MSRIAGHLIEFTNLALIVQICTSQSKIGKKKGALGTATTMRSNSTLNPEANGTDYVGHWDGRATSISLTRY